MELKTAWITDMMSPRWMTNWANFADRLYEFLPCHRSNFVRKLNWSIEKSAASDACFPSFPTMPTPTWREDSQNAPEARLSGARNLPTSAAWIMLTSFPPSPMQQTRFFVYSRISLATSAFWVGEQRHATTTGSCVAISIKLYLCCSRQSLCKQTYKQVHWGQTFRNLTCKDSPSITRQHSNFVLTKSNISSTCWFVFTVSEVVKERISIFRLFGRNGIATFCYLVDILPPSYQLAGHRDTRCRFYLVASQHPDF